MARQTAEGGADEPELALLRVRTAAGRAAAACGRAEPRANSLA